MKRIWRHIGAATVFAASVAFAQDTGMPATPPSGAPTAVQPDAMSKISASVKDAYSNIDRAKGVLTGNSPTQRHTAAQFLSKAENDFGVAKKALPAGMGEKTQTLDKVQGEVASARKLLHNGHATEAEKKLEGLPQLSEVQQDLQKELGGATGIGGAGSMGNQVPSGNEINQQPSGNMGTQQQPPGNESSQQPPSGTEPTK